MSRALVNKKINTRWFKRVLEDQKMSERAYGRLVGEDTAIVNRKFRGLRRFGIDDAEQFSRVTGATLEEVLKNAGMELEDLQRQRVAKLAGWIDGGRRIHPKVRGPKNVIAPPDAITGTLAYRYQTEGTGLEAMDGAITYCRPLGDLDIGMLGRWCIVRLRDGTELVRVVNKTRTAGRFDLWDETKERERSVLIDAAALVEWVKF